MGFEAFSSSTTSIENIDAANSLYSVQDISHFSFTAGQKSGIIRIILEIVDPIGAPPFQSSHAHLYSISTVCCPAWHP